MKSEDERHKNMRRFRTAMVATAASALVLLATPVAAQADTDIDTPKAAVGEFSVWYNSGYSGLCVSAGGNIWDYSTIECNDRASSVFNNGTPGGFDDVWMYQDAGYTGLRRGIYNGVRLENLQNWNYDGTSINMNDSISSHQWTNLP
jgi:hypothetical protein